MSPVQLSRQLQAEPFPVWLLSVPSDAHPLSAPDGFLKLCIELDESLFSCLFRGMNGDRIVDVLRNGIDVEPTNSVIWASDYDKAWEYGDWPKLLLALRPECLRKSYRIVTSTAPPEELEVIQREYPTCLESRDGTSLLFSRLPEDDPRAGSGYERAHAFWIPGEALAALKAAFVIARPQDVLTPILEAFAG